MVEVGLTLVIIAIMTAMMVPKISLTIRSNQTRRSAAIVAADLERAFTLAARYRKPMRLSCVCGSGTYTIADLAGGTVRVARNLREDADFGRMTLTFSANPVDIFPSGISSAPNTVQITSGASTRTIVMTTAGQVRILP